MEESMVHIPTVGGENEREEPASCKTALEVSVSFGRFENESLSWERWSSFSQNKYLEEVGKCSTPGSVAEKKAYFEAHYKKIPARNMAEQRGQEVQMEAHTLGSEETTSGDLITSSCELNGESSSSITDAREPRTNSLSLVSSSNTDELNEDAEVTDSNKEAALDVDCPVSFGEEVKEELEGRFDSPKSNTLNMGILVQEISPMRSQATMDLPQQLDNGAANTQTNKVEDSKLKLPKDSQKRTPATKKKSLTRKKNSPASLTPKSPQISISGSSKSRLASSVIFTTQTPAKKGSRSSLQTSRNLSTVESRRSTTASLSKSLTLQPENSNSASVMTTRKSLIMEKMGDKEIVKRAFKAFQYRFNQLRPTTETEPSAAGQVSTKVKGQTKSALMTRQKDMEGTRNEREHARAPRMQIGAGENVRVPRMQMGARQNPVSARPFKAASVDHLHSAPSSPFVLRSSERAEKRKEFFKRLEEKSNAKEVKKMQLQLKSKEEKDAGIRKLRQSLNFKATPLPDFYGGQVSKTLVK